MDNSTTNLSLCIFSILCFAATSIIFLTDASISPLNGSVASLAGVILVTLSPIISSTLVFARIFKPKSWKSPDLDRISIGWRIFLMASFEVMLLLGANLATMDLPSSSYGWKLISGISLLSLHLALSSYLIGIYPIMAAISVYMIAVVRVGRRFGEETDSFLPMIVTWGNFAVLLALVHHLNFPRAATAAPPPTKAAVHNVAEEHEVENMKE